MKWLWLLCLIYLTKLLNAYDEYAENEEVFQGYDDMYGGGGGYGDIGDMFSGMNDMPGMGPGGYGGYGGYGGGDPYGGYGGGDEMDRPTEIVTAEDLDEFTSAEQMTPCLVGFFDMDLHEDDMASFMDAAHSLLMSTDVRIGIAVDTKLLQAMGYTKGYRIMAYPVSRFIKEKVDRSKVRYPGGGVLNSKSLEKWAYKATTPTVDLLSYSSMERLKGIGLPELTLFTSVDLEHNGKGFDYFANRLRTVAAGEGVTKKMTFTIADVEEQARRMASCKFDDADTASSKEGKAFVGIKDGTKYYRMKDEFSTESVAFFVASFLKGELAVTNEVEDDSEAVPPSSAEDEEGGFYDGSDVVQLTAANMDDVINDATKDLFVEVYANWCGHCKHLAPHYKELAKEFAEDEGVTIAALEDGDTEGVPAMFNVEGYPTLLFLKASDKSHPIPYDGPREVAAMAKWIRARASSPNIAAAAATAATDEL